MPGGNDELIERFSFHAWARQALGPVGLALGWTPVLRAATSKKARAGLDEFIAAEDREQA